ncbi:MAG: hypothetical protein KAS86_03300 [Candidatus Omnitrophica bacterium]|nr:hypothetical protein [Candidatus Omnitrophota bacterium]
MNTDRWIRIYGTAIIIYGVYNLIGTGNYRQFAVMFKGVPGIVIIAAYAFSIVYGICGVYCGMRISRFEDWARKVMVGLTSVSVVLGFMLSKTVMANFRNYILAPETGVPPELAGRVYGYMVIFTVLATVFELSVIVFFTRHGVLSQFKSR